MAMKDNYGKQESEKYWNIMIKQLLTFLKILDNTPDNFLAWPNTEEAMWLDKQIDLYTQTEEETAEGEAFFDNISNGHTTVIELHLFGE